MLVQILFALIADLPVPGDLVHFADGQEAAFASEDAEWASALRERGAVVQMPDGRLRLYFTGYDGTREGLRRVGLAESDDGGLTWEVRSEPVSPANTWIEDPFVFYDGHRYQMLAEGRGDHPLRLSSSDGVQWTSEGPLTIRSATGEVLDPPAGTPVVVRKDDRWHLLYERRDAGIWLATSSDLQNWTNVSDTPVFTPSADGFDSVMIAFNQVVRCDGRFYAYYHGTDSPQKPRAWAVGVAVSTDLKTWERYSGNPITEPEANRSSPWLVDGADGPRLLTTHGSIQWHRSTVGGESHRRAKNCRTGAR